MRKNWMKLLAMALAIFMVCPLALAENTEAPRAYFPYHSEIENLPENLALPDLFEFFDASADPDGSGRVETVEEWDARADELKDMLQYYLYGNRNDPLKGDTKIVALRENYQFIWADGVVAAGGWFGPSVPPALPEGAATFSTFSWGPTTYYMNIAPNYEFVHEGEDYQLPGELGVWKAGEGWDAHPDVVQKVLLPAVSVDVLIRDTNPENDGIRSEAAAGEGVPFTFTIRFPAAAPIVDGQLRDETASRNGAGYPLMVSLGGLSEAQIVTLNNNGYVYISASDSGNPDSGSLSVYEKVYPPIDPMVYNDNTIVNDYERDTGDLMHSGWVASRAMDAIENYMLLSDEEKAAIHPTIKLPNIDVYSSAITGCSNVAKRAVIGGIFDTGDNGDTRFDIIALSDPGGGGMSGFRYSTEGQLFSYEAPQTNSGASVVPHDYPYGLNETTQRAVQNTGEDNWFLDRAQILTVRPDVADNMPIDSHSLAAAFATTKEDRYFVTFTGEAQDAWLNSPATALNMIAAKEAYEFIGQGGNIALLVRDQAHANQDRDMAEILAVMDHAFYGTEKVVRKYHATLTSNGLNAADGSGTILPTKVFDTVAEMWRNPYFLPSTYINWSRPTKHTLWTDANSVTEGVPLTFAFNTDAQKVELLLTDGVTKLEAEVVDGVALIPLTAEQAKAGQYVATAIGEKDAKSIEICGWTVNDALRHALADNSALGHDVGTGICFTTPLLNYASAEDAPVLYLNGEVMPTDIYDYDNKITLEDGTVIPQHGYLQPYGATLILYEGTMGYNVPMGDKVVYSIRNAKIEALQGFTLNMDVELEKYEPSAGRMRFKPVYNTLTAQTPTWEPDLLQNTPKSGLPKDETLWPILGNWKHDFDAEGHLKPIEEIRPLYSVKGEAAYKVEITAAASDVNGVTLNFSAPVSTKDFAVAINCGCAVSFEWAEDAQSVKVVYDAPVEAGTEVTLFVFRSVDSEGNMIGGPVKFVVTAE